MEGAGVVPWKKTATTGTAVLLLFVLSTSTAPALAVICTDIQPGIQPCIGAMSGLLPPSLTVKTATAACCNGLKMVEGLEKQVGVEAACSCTRSALLNIPGLDINVKVSSALQSQCNVDLGFSLSNNDPCTS